ncbi:PDC sensor domain-containing protein [Candidatus Halobeggiatoa sp. HSG11]|nr:PDC sensor domain-containing protein [Candidatus Halobeggiatoa sp. HSG11]
MSIIHTAIVFLFLSNTVVVEQKQISQEHLQMILTDKIKRTAKLGTHPLLIKAVKEQNAKNVSLDNIKKIDQEWTSTNDLTPFKESLQTSLEGKFLKRKITNNESIYNEAFLTDNQGANVAAYPATSDYWQGDETKWSESFNTGKVYIGPVEFDESTNTNAVQISVPVIDEGKTIGVLVFGVRLSFVEAEELQSSK